MAKLYADENFSYPVVQELRQLGHDVLTAQEAGQANQRVPDSQVLAFAAGQGRAVLTFNRRHFIRLHAQIQPHGGIVICTRDNDVAALAARIHQAVTQRPRLDNQLIRVIRPPTP
jgi:predicted nuclease of predicted toxin-antitoxin system